MRNKRDEVDMTGKSRENGTRKERCTIRKADLTRKKE